MRKKYSPCLAQIPFTQEIRLNTLEGIIRMARRAYRIPPEPKNKPVLTGEGTQELGRPVVSWCI